MKLLHAGLLNLPFFHTFIQAYRFPCPLFIFIQFNISHTSKGCFIYAFLLKQMQERKAFDKAREEIREKRAFLITFYKMLSVGIRKLSHRHHPQEYAEAAVLCTSGSQTGVIHLSKSYASAC